jgi:hypothetical protein
LVCLQPDVASSPLLASSQSASQDTYGIFHSPGLPRQQTKMFFVNQTTTTTTAIKTQHFLIQMDLPSERLGGG